MTPDIVFVWVAVLSFVLNGIRLWQAQKQAYGGWLFGLAVLCGGLAVFDIPNRGYIAGVLWALYMLVGQILAMIELRGWMRRDWRILSVIGYIRCGLYPLSPSFDALSFIRAMQQIERNPAQPITVRPRNQEQQQMLMAWRMMVSGDYDTLIAWTQKDSPHWRCHWLWMTRQRALMEQGQAALVAEEYQQRDQNNFTAHDLGLLRLGFFAYSGDVAMTNMILGGPLRHLHPVEQELWRLRAHAAAGQPAPDIQTQLMALAQKPAPLLIQRAITREQTRCPYQPDMQSPTVQTLIAQWRTNLAQAPQPKKPLFSLLVIIINIIMFALTTDLNGDVRLDAAYRMGIAIYPEMAETGAWWRLVTANFLHANWVHLVMNMIGVIWIGTDLERHLGIWRYGLIYLLSGIGTMVIGIVMYDLMNTNPDQFMALGASGAIFGLLGSFALLSWHRWRWHHAEKGKNALKGVMLILAIQSVFDFIYLEGSSTLHIAGFLTGMLISLLVLPRSFRVRLFTDH